MLFVDLATVSEAVGATRSRREKTAALAGVIAGLGPGEVEPAVAMLAGGFRQGRIGVGWASTSGIDVAPAAAPSLTIGAVDRAVATIARLSGPGSQADRAAELEQLFGAATAPEQDLLGRLFVGDVRHGALEGLVTDAVAKAAGVPLAVMRRAAMLTGDLPEAASLALTGGRGVLEAVELRPGTPVQPMLASTATSVAEAIDGEASVEWKLDGARVQVHRTGDRISIWTRNLNDVTERMPEIAAAVAALDVRSIVLDGEAMALRPDGTPEPFAETASRFGTAERAIEDAALVPHFFDVLHLDGASLVDEPLIERLDALDRVVPEVARIPRLRTSDPVAAEQFLAEALAAGHEGVMVKAADSVYEAGRRGAAWRKVKPVHTFDLVVLAVEWGSGRRRGWLSNIHLGARDGDDLVMVGKTFKGMTDEMLAWQTERFLELETAREGHVVHVRPEQVVEVAIDGAQSSTRYPAGVALRFARVRRYRDDKGPAEADTIEALRALLR
ncbi:MAG: ATP-dependent DNA ligase [Acidimicrobiia bacterium]